MPPDPQLQTLSLYTALAGLRPDWPGALILAIGLPLEAQPLAFAALTVGAAILSLEPSPDHCRAANRTGACDFLVNTVDEALRVLKNEIRQHKPLSVALELAPDAALTELRDRGVLPQLFLDPTHAHEPLGPEARDLAGQAQQIIEANDWQHREFAFASSAELRAFDARLQTLIAPRDSRHRWLTSAPRLFPRDRTRHVLLTSTEFQALTSNQ